MSVKNPFDTQFTKPRTATMTGAETFTNATAMVQILDPGGAARTITLPALELGLYFHIANEADAAEAITVQDTEGPTTVETLSQNQGGYFWCDGTTWHSCKYSAVV